MSTAKKSLIKSAITLFLLCAGVIAVINYAFLTDSDVSPTAYASFSLTTVNPGLEPVISVMNKYLEAGGVGGLHELYDNGSHQYSKHLVNLAASAAVLMLLLIILIILLIKNSKMRKQFQNQMITISTIYKSLPDLVFCKDINGAYTSCNSKFEEFAGYSEAELTGKTAFEVSGFHNRVSDLIANTDYKVISEKTAAKVREWITYPDQSRRFVESLKVPLIDDGGEVTGLIGIIRDITELHLAMEEIGRQNDLLKIAANKANEANMAKSNFLAHMSHEIRTPMNAITGITELALRENNPESAREHILMVKQASANLLSIINDILDFSKIESGTLEIIPVEYSFSSLINDVISIVRMRIIDSPIQFAVNVDSNIPNMMIGDEPRIRQALINLLSNAVKYTEKGFVTFTVYGETTDKNTISLTMEIMDSGRGIKREDVDKLFSEYIQVDTKKNKDIDGVGLGLTITRSLIKAMDGDISVCSEYGKGSTFTVTLPQKIQNHEILAVVNSPEKKKTLVYERRKIYANSLAFTVDNLGVHCVVVLDDSDLREKLSDGAFSFIFVSFALYEKNKDIILEFGKDARVVILTEFGETIKGKNLNTLAMPAYSISVANILNGVSIFSYGENHEPVARLTAPDAKILVVDDINTNLIVAKGLLMPYKMQVDLCHSGMEAIEAVRSKYYDLVFMDHRMPEMDGMEATEHIRALGDEKSYYKNLPIIALTANAVAGMKEMYLENGFNDYLSKPVDTIKLDAILKRWIPRIKQKHSAVEIHIADAVDERENNIEIDGLNVDKGILISGGTMDYYLETLAAFYNDGLERTGEIKKCLENENMSLFTTYIHALKSAAANIGADELSEFAKVLELAGKQKDLSFIKSNSSRFLTDLELVLGKIKSVISAHREKKGKERLDTETFKTELVTLKTALDAMDAGAINKAIDCLLKSAYTEMTASVVRNISNSIILAEYDEAATLIETLLREIQ